MKIKTTRNKTYTLANYGCPHGSNKVGSLNSHSCGSVLNEKGTRTGYVSLPSKGNKNPNSSPLQAYELVWFEGKHDQVTRRDTHDSRGVVSESELPTRGGLLTLVYGNSSLT